VRANQRLQPTASRGHLVLKAQVLARSRRLKRDVREQEVTANGGRGRKKVKRCDGTRLW